jgi:TPR repeat protein
LYSCYSLANLLLRGDRVNKAADNVSPQEAQGIVPIVKRQNEKDRSSTGKEPYVIPRDPKKAEALLKKGCDVNNHVTSCHNLAVMYGQGDDGVPANEELAEKYKKKTRENLHFYGGFGG